MSVRDYAIKQAETALGSFEKMDDGGVESFVSALSSSDRRIFFSGVGKNGHVASKAASTFNSIGLKVTYIDPVDAVHGDLGMISDGDMVVAISKSGSTEELIRFLEHCSRRTSDVWLLHSKRGNESLRYARNEVYLEIDSEADHLNLVPTSSIAAYVIFMQAVACEIASRKGLDLAGFLKNHPGGSIGRLEG